MTADGAPDGGGAAAGPATEPGGHAPSGLRTARVTSEDGAVVCERCEIADRMLPRMRGLLGRSGLAPGGGMLINPSPSVHMFFMRFAIDVVFLDRASTIVRVVDELRPWRVASARRAAAALELPAGTAQRLGLRQGTRLEFDPPLGR